MTEFKLQGEATTEGDELAPREFKVIPAGTVLLAEVLSVEVRDSFFWLDVEDHSKGKQKEVNFKFGIVDKGEFNNWKVYGTTPTTFNVNEKCKLRRWVEEIFAFDALPSGFEFDTDDLIGEPVNVVIGHRTYNDKTTGKPVTKVFVESLVRFSGGFEETTDDQF